MVQVGKGARQQSLRSHEKLEGIDISPEQLRAVHNAGSKNVMLLLT